MIWYMLQASYGHVQATVITDTELCGGQCALPTAVVEELVERALSLLTCGYDPARKNVALFFGAAIHFRGILDVFDRAGGLPRLLDAMRTVLHLLRAPAHGENRTEKQARPHSTTMHHSHRASHLNAASVRRTVEDGEACRW